MNVNLNDIQTVIKSAAEIGCSKQWLYFKIATGDVATVRIGKQTFVYKNDISAIRRMMKKVKRRTRKKNKAGDNTPAL